MSPRQSNGWGECVNCGETLKPEDEEPWSDRCPFCLKLTAVFHLVNERTFNAEKVIKTVDTPKAIEYWQTRIDAYKAIHTKLREALKIKKDELWGESY